MAFRFPFRLASFLVPWAQNPALRGRIDQSSKVLAKSYYKLGKSHLQRMLVLSALLHAIVLAVRFVPDTFKRQWDKESLVVVLVNTAESATSSQAQALANATLQGGGDADAGLVSSPLPNMGATQDGDELSTAAQQVQALEKQQAALLSALKGASDTKAPSGHAFEYNPEKGSLIEPSSAILMRQIAALDKQVQDYNKRPIRKQLSPATREAAFAAYFAQWTERTETLGNQFYPDAARGQAAELTITVSVRKDGSLENIELVQSSGKKSIDHAALLLLKRLAPYPPFTGAIKDRVDVLDITTKLIFTPANAMSAEVFANEAGKAEVKTLNPAASTLPATPATPATPVKP